MKQILTLVLMTWAAFNLSAQVLFEQNFENGMAPMTLVNNDGKTPASPVAAYVDAWNVANPTFGNGTNVAVSTSWYAPPGAADDWMITPAITVADANTVLSWEAKAQDPAYPDGYQVLLSTTDSLIGSFTESLFTIGAELTTWQARSASLANYVGQTVYIAFRNNSNDMFLLLMDNIKVANVLEYDVALTKFNPYRYHVAGDNLDIEVEIENQGGQTITSLTFGWSDGVNDYVETVSGLNIANGETATLVHSTPFTVNEAKRYDLSVWVDSPNGNPDGSTVNNLSDGSVIGITYAPAKKMVAEEGTGTWCGYCPYGTDYMLYMADTYPDQFIGIAVHNEDPMVVTAYDAGVGAFPGFGGYPNVILDRTEVIHPLDFEDYATSYFERVVPVAPTLDATLDVATRTLTANVSAEMLSTLENLDFRFNLVLTEDLVTGTSAGYAQTNYFSTQSQNIPDPLADYGLDWNSEPNPVPAADMVYDFVARAIADGFSGVAGSIPASVSAGEFATKEYTVSNFNTGWNPFNMHAIVMVLDNETGEALNAERVEIEVVCPTDFGASFDVTEVTTTGTNDGAVDMTPPSNSFGFGGYTYEWSHGPTTADVENLDAGTYTVTISDKIGCTQTVDVVVNFATGVEAIEKLASFSLTPNPASSFALLNAQFTQAVDAQLVILDETGRTVQQVAFKNTAAVQHRFDLSDLAPGAYFVKMSVGNQVHSSNLMIAK